MDFAHIAAPTDSAKVGPLTNGITYNLTAAWHNEVGTGPQTAPIMVTPMTTPGAATGLVATPVNNGTVLSWKAPTSNGGSAVNYFVDEKGDQVGTTTDTSITINGLANGITYNFAVTAHNQMGNGTV